MLQEESDLSLIIAQIVQKLKGSNLYAQLERQAWVSEAEREGMETGGAAVMPAPRLQPANLSGSPPLVSPAPLLGTEKLPLQVEAPLAQPRAWGSRFLKQGGAHPPFL